MNKDILSALRPAAVLALLFALLLGVAYPLAMTGIGQSLFPSEANGSLVMVDGKAVGSAVVGQQFTEARYFHSRPSAAGDGYDGLSSGGSNLGPTSKDLHERVAGDVATYRSQAGEGAGAVPMDMVTASGSGLDPHITPEAALYQVERVAAARGMQPDRVRQLVQANIEHPFLGFIGEPKINLLKLNRLLDAESAA